MSFKRKCIIILSIALITLLTISSCNNSLSSDLRETEDFSSHIESTEHNNISTDIAPSLPNQEKERIIITVDELDEETFIEHLDIDILTTVAEKLQEVTDEIVRKQAADPESVIKGEWVTDFRNSEQYQYVIDQGVKVVKPLYYILYKSNQAGLYEYIISSAIYDIIGYDFSDNKDYQWANAYEFREKYNVYVKESISQFYIILDDESINQTDKINKITDLGIFVIAPLLNELDYTNSELDNDTIYTILGKIINTSFDNEGFESINTWRGTNEKYYWYIIEILPLY